MILYYDITTILCVYIPWIITPALTFSESFLGMGPQWIPNIEAEWLCMVDYGGCDQSHKRLCGCRQSPGVHRCPTADLRKRICRRPCAVMVDYEIFLGDAQSGGYVGWGFADYHKVSCGLDHILTLARCAEIPSAHLKGMRQIFQDLGFKKMDNNTMISILAGQGKQEGFGGWLLNRLAINTYVSFYIWYYLIN